MNDKIPFKETIDGMLYERLGKTTYIEIYPDPAIYTKGALTMTGIANDITKQIHIAYVHRICRLVLYHMTSAYAASNDAMKCVLERPQNHIPALDKMADQPLRKFDITASKFIKAFRDFEVAPIRPSIWKLTLASTNTDVVVPILTIQILGGI